VAVTREVRRGGIEGLFGGKRDITEYITKQVPVQKQITVPKEVTRSRTVRTSV